MKLSNLVVVLAFMACVNSVNAALVSYDFADGLQGWTLTPVADERAVVEWRSWVPPVGNEGAVYFNHQGAQGSSYALSPMIPVTNGQQYTLTFDYATWGQTQSANVHFFSIADGAWKGVGATAYDELAWGQPSLFVTSTTAWNSATKSVTFDAAVAGDTVGYIQLQFFNGATWGETWYDNIAVTATPEPASMALLGLGALGLLRKKKA